ncbi:MAG TPA: LmeA family phospholipid-binding protein [Candidatus Obscuribacterales bacterium]
MQFPSVFPAGTAHRLLSWAFAAAIAVSLPLAHAQTPEAGSAADAPQAQSQPQPAGQTLKDALGRALSTQGMQAGQSLGNPQGPILVPPISFVDINSGRFGKLEMDIEDGHFMDGSVDKMHILARDLDLAEGLLKSLNVDVTGGHFQDFTFDQLTLNTEGDLHFDSGILFNHRMFKFTTPAQAQVTAVISQNSLNKFINSPRTLDRLSARMTRPGGMLANLLGAAPGNVGFNLTGGDIKLGKSNSLMLNLDTRVGIGQVGVPIPVAVNTKLELKDGWPLMTDTKVLTAGQQLPPELSRVLVDKVNSLANWGTRSEDIHFSFTDLKVVPGNRCILRGTAEVNQLRFSRLGT